MSPRAAAGRAPAFSRPSYERDYAAFFSQLEEELYQHGAGLRDELAVAPIYEQHASLFSADAVEGLHRLVEAGGAELGRNRALLAAATDGFVAREVATLTDAVGTAEATAAVIWRGESIPYRALRNRIGETPGRAERNGLFASYLEAEEAINPLRRERFERIGEVARDLGYADYVAMMRTIRGFDPDALGAQVRGFLAESETFYFAALRRFLARIEIELGDASQADLWYLLRGSGWDNWFDGKRMPAVLEATLRGLGIDLRGQAGATLDMDPRPNKAPRAFVAVVDAPRDVRLVVQPHGGWDDYGAMLHEAGHLEHFLHVDPRLPVASRILGDSSVTEGYAMTFERLLAEPEWLSERLGMPVDHATAFVDFFSLYHLAVIRTLAAHHLHELRARREGDDALHRATYAGLVGLLVGVREPEERYLLIDDGMYAASYLRCFMLDGALTDYLVQHHGAAWWRTAAAGETLRRAWSRGQEWNAEQVVAHLGYDSLDWRPVVRQVRAKLVGEMSGYGGPNITTRAGTRKV